MPRQARRRRMTRLLAASTGAPDRPPASVACSMPATASRLRVVLVAITPKALLAWPWLSVP
ncbi:hypothetical protein D3C87_2070670 [compost metagenome]